jgi:hypothetical protein
VDFCGQPLMERADSKFSAMRNNPFLDKHLRLRVVSGPKLV